ncbi:DUF4811 domain-containing protein [Agrilactobacillus yilanensis]|uniref:DUF4811 domain-containing protein n=1 Tax=Agrilactobacillus yilanensis TaxID=2485997 RepID=A0ABW4J790_9LACO|nr:DUF4811 domain-containing protein [Agrilactobacillus yilanensis]
MILIILFIGLIAFIVGLLFLDTPKSQWTVGGLGLLVLSTAALLMIGNDNWHWGMHQTTTTTTTKITSVSGQTQLPLLVYQPLKKSTTERVYIYQNRTSQKRQLTQANLKTTNKVLYQSTATQAKLVTTTKKWRYNQGLWRWLFENTGKHHELIARTNTFILPTTWTTLSYAQSQWLKTQVTSALKDQATTTLTAQQQAAALATLVAKAKAVKSD